MGDPLILYGLAPLVNPSFETDDDGDDPPTGWTDTSTNGINEVDDAEAQSAGSGIPSLKSLKQNVDDATGGNKAVLTQRVALPDLVEVLAAAGGELAAAISIKAESQVGLKNAQITIRLYQSDGTSTPGTGTEITAPASRRFLAAGPIWFLQVATRSVTAASAWVDLEISYDIVRAGYDAGGSVWWDRALLGGLVDLSKGFSGRVQTEFLPHAFANEGDGVVEVIRTRKPRTRVDVELRNLLHLQDDELAMDAFMGWLSSSQGTIAFWRSRDDLTNAGRHFQLCTIDPKIRIRNPAGILRDEYRLRFWAASEGLG